MTDLSRFSGAFTATITPFTASGTVDEKNYQRFLEWQISEGVRGLVPTGTTGESPTLSHAEHDRVIDLTIEVAKNRVPVIAGCGSNSTKEAIRLTQHAKKAGADAAMLVTPYYNKPTQAGLYAHYAAVAKAVDIPIIIYNIPGRSVVDMSVETMARLVRDFPHIIGVKDASNQLERIMHTRLAIGDKFVQFTGEDPTMASFLAHGGHGCISVVANIAPKLTSRLVEAWQKGDLNEFSQYRDALFPLSVRCFSFASPTATVKTALAMMGKIEAEVRLPLVELDEQEQKLLTQSLQSAKLL